MCQRASWNNIRGGLCSALDKCAETVRPLWIGFGNTARLTLGTLEGLTEPLMTENETEIFLILYTVNNDTLSY